MHRPKKWVITVWFGIMCVYLFPWSIWQDPGVQSRCWFYRLASCIREITPVLATTEGRFNGDNFQHWHVFLRLKFLIGNIFIFHKNSLLKRYTQILDCVVFQYVFPLSMENHFPSAKSKYMAFTSHVFQPFGLVHVLFVELQCVKSLKKHTE